ncbi:MAG: hypothetical protein P1U36_06015 [Legionellaceae bacterium]|nr:hypothetical protein [Legionellaceae bacterium]
MPTINNYFLEYAPDVWGYVDLSVNDDGALTGMRASNQSVDFQMPSVYPAYGDNDNDDASKGPFWLAISESGLLYRLDYNPTLKSAPVAKPLSGVELGKRYAREKILPKNRFVDGAFNQAVYQGMQEAGARQYKKIKHKAALQACEHERRPSDLLSAFDLESKLVREADAVYREQLLGAEEDPVFAKIQSFQKQCHASYIHKAQTELQAIISEYPEDYIAFKQALIAYLAQHWQVIKATPLSYTGLSEHPVTQLLVGIAEKLEAFDGEPAISYLMPDVYIQSQWEAHIPSLDKQSLSNVLRTHILDENGYYLLPVHLLLDKTAVLHEQSSALISEHGFRNPFFDMNTDQDRAHQYVSLKDFERLFQHSGETQALRNSYQRFDLAAHDDVTLLGQLNYLVSVLKTNDADEGIGYETDVGDAVYTVAPNFMVYYRRLHPIGFHVSKDKLPSLREAWGDEYEMSYILVQSGPDAGLHFLSRYDDDGRLRTLDESDRETYREGYEETRGPLCDGKKPAQYPIIVMAREAFEDSPELRATLSDEHPTLIRIPTEEPGTYYIYGQQTDGRWDFQTMIDAGPIILPKKCEHEDWVLDYDAAILQSPANIPEAIYTAIQTQGGHHEQRLMLDVLQEAFDAFKHGQPLEILKVIEAQTGHLDLEEFKQVPDAIRNPLNRLWQYLGNSGTNIAATETIETCVGMLKEQLKPAVGAYTDTLKKIGWSAAEKEHEYDESVAVLRSSQEVLARALERGHYQGIDIRAPSPEMLRALGMTLNITGPDDFRWFCSFPPESINAFLSDPSDSDGSELLQYILDNYYDFDDLSLLLLEIPLAAYKPILLNLEYTLNVDGLYDFLKFLDADDKKEALLDTFKDQLTTIISNNYQLGRVLKLLNEKQRDLVLDVFKSKLAIMLRDRYELKMVIEPLNEAQCCLVLDAFEDKLTTVLKDGYEIGHALEFLNEAKQDLLLAALQDKLVKMITDADQLEAILKRLNEKQRDWVLNQFSFQLLFLITNGEKLGAVLSTLSVAQCGRVLDEFEDDLTRMGIYEFELAFKLEEILGPLNEEQSRFVLKVFSDKLTMIFSNYNNLIRILLPLKEQKRTLILEELDDKLVALITNGEQLARLLQFLNHQQRTFVLEKLEDRIAIIFQDVAQLGAVLSTLDETQCTFVLDKIHSEVPVIFSSRSLIKNAFIPMQFFEPMTQENAQLLLALVAHLLKSSYDINQLPELYRGAAISSVKNISASNIRASWQLFHILEGCSDERFEEILAANTIMKWLNQDKCAYQLHDVLKVLTPSRCQAFLMSMKHDELMGIVNNGGLSNLLGNPSELVEEKIRLVIKHVGGDLHSVLKIDEFGFSLDGYAKRSKRCLLKALEDELPDLITTRDTLNGVLNACGDDKESVNIVLSSLKGRLNRMVSFDYEDNRQDVIRASQPSEQGIFSSFTSSSNRIRSEAINVGALSSKIAKYSAFRQLEGSFHWDFLGLMAFVYLISDWFSGEPWVKAQNTKLAAATYALHANKNDDACLVRLAQVDLLPNERTLQDLFTNSYLLIGAGDAPKQLYYIDYEGKTTIISMTNTEGVDEYFSQQNDDARLTYRDIHDNLNGHTQGLLPTDAQLAALKEGLLGDIMRDAGVDDVLDGTKRPLCSPSASL